MTRSREAVAAIYEDLEGRVVGVARRVARRAGHPDPDDLVGEARLIFLRALDGHDPAQGPLEARVCFLVRNRLKDRITYETRRRAGRTRVRLRADSAAVIPRHFDRDGLRDALGPDGRAVVDLVLSCPEGLTRVRNGQESRCWLRRYLADLGWAADRAVAALAEVADALARS